MQPVVFGLAEWGARWAFGEPDPDELDADLLLWWLHRRLNPDTLRGHRFVVYVHFTDRAEMLAVAELMESLRAHG